MQLKTTLAALIAVAGLTLGASQAQATTFAGSWTANYNTGNGLIIGITPVNPTFNFTLGPGNEEITIDLFRVYTPENSSDFDDIFFPKNFSLSFNFTQPQPNSGPVGDTGLTGSIGLGYLDWDPANLLVVNGGAALSFGPGATPADQGLLTIRNITGGLFQVGGAPESGLMVRATFHWDRDPAAVPEPATWALMIGGFGVAGGMLRRRRAVTA